MWSRAHFAGGNKRVSFGIQQTATYEKGTEFRTTPSPEDTSTPVARSAASPAVASADDAVPSGSETAELQNKRLSFSDAATAQTEQVSFSASATALKQLEGQRSPSLQALIAALESEDVCGGAVFESLSQSLGPEFGPVTETTESKSRPVVSSYSR